MTLYTVREESFDSLEEINLKEKNIELNHLPLRLVKMIPNSGKWEVAGHQEDYKIKNDEDFVKLSDARRTKDFLLRTCRSVK